MKHLLLTLFALLTINTNYAQTSGDVKIGNQVWMSRNLNVDTFKNGEPIPQAMNEREWENACDKNQPIWCYYDYSESNGKIYGKLYNWFAVVDPRGLAPNGYHIPSDNEWTALVNIIGNEYNAGDKLKSKQGWKPISNNGKKKCQDCLEWNEEYRNKVPCNTCRDTRWIKVEPAILNGGENSSGFSAMPGGYAFRGYTLNNHLETRGYFWSSTEVNQGLAWIRFISYDNDNIVRIDGAKTNGYSVRCIKD